MADRDEKGRYLPAHSIAGPGRKSGYDPAMNEVARKLALLGLTDPEISQFFDVSRQTLENWKKENPAFLDALNSGKQIADANVAEGLYKRAIGMDVFEERLAHRPGGGQKVTQVRKQLPPDPGAAAIWLASRQRGRWGKAAGGAGPDGQALPPGEDGDLNALDDNALDARIAALEARRKHGE